MKKEQRNKIREHLGLSRYNRFPIELIAGSEAPTIVGKSYGWQTRGGKKIYYPTAYIRKGWSSITYVPSSQKIIVGEDWL